MRLSRLLNRIVIQAAVAFGFSSAVALANFSFVKIADTNTTTADGDIKGILIPPVIDGGDVAFQAGMGGSTVGIFRGSGGPLTKIVKSGDPAPNGVFNFLGTAAPSISNGQVAFSGAFGSGGLSSVHIFVGDGGDPATVVKPGDSAGSVILGELQFSYPVLSDGKVAFPASYSGGSGIFLGNATSLSAIVKSGDIAPEGTFNQIFSSSPPAISSNSVAFVGGFSGKHGIFVGDGGPLTTIIKVGDTAPVGTFNTLSTPSISGDSVAFVGRYGTTNGVFVKDTLGLKEIASVGDMTPAGLLTEVGSPAISGTNVAFRGAFSGGSGIFVGNEIGLMSVIKTGDMLFGQVVDRVGFANGLDPRGSGNLALVYELTNGVRGIAMAIPVPEPNSVGVIAVIVLALANCGRWRSICTSRHTGRR